MSPVLKLWQCYLLCGVNFLQKRTQKVGRNVTSISVQYGMWSGLLSCLSRPNMLLDVHSLWYYDLHRTQRNQVSSSVYKIARYLRWTKTIYEFFQKFFLSNGWDGKSARAQLADTWVAHEMAVLTMDEGILQQNFRPFICLLQRSKMGKHTRSMWEFKHQWKEKRLPNCSPSKQMFITLEQK